MVSKKYDQKHFFKLLLLYKVRKTDLEKNNISLEVFKYLADIIRKAKRKVFQKLQKYKGGKFFKNNNDIFYEDTDIENESFICLIKCLNNFKIVKEVKQKGTFLGYYKISLERHLNRHLIEKVFSGREDEIGFDISNSKISNGENLFEKFTELEIKIIYNQNKKNKEYKEFCNCNCITIEQYKQILENIKTKYKKGL